MEVRKENTVINNLIYVDQQKYNNNNEQNLCTNHHKMYRTSRHSLNTLVFIIGMVV